jgi:hypothetical protein
MSGLDGSPTHDDAALLVLGDATHDELRILIVDRVAGRAHMTWQVLSLRDTHHHGGATIAAVVHE